jgi:hypothetical protein
MPSSQINENPSKENIKNILDSIKSTRQNIKKNKNYDEYPYSLINIGYCCGC